jgi:ribonuclease HI
MIIVHFDGACGPMNPRGHMGYGASIVVDGKTIDLHGGEFENEENSNNVAEYKGLLLALQYLMDHGLHHQPIKIYGDSNLVILQMKGRWRIKGGRYADFAQMAKSTLPNFKHIEFQWIPRDKNSYADSLSNEFFVTHGLKQFQKVRIGKYHYDGKGNKVHS